MKILDTMGDFNYVYYNSCDKLSSEYDRMYGIINATGHSLSSDAWSLDAGILLENNDIVIAGAFLNLTHSDKVVLIHIIFVEEEYRKQGIYLKMHSLIDTVGREFDRHAVYSYIHARNELMNEHIMKKIGYEPVMHLVRRPITGDKNETN